jgi:hypothetical protein
MNFSLLCASANRTHARLKTPFFHIPRVRSGLWFSISIACSLFCRKLKSGIGFDNPAKFSRERGPGVGIITQGLMPDVVFFSMNLM